MKRDFSMNLRHVLHSALLAAALVSSSAAANVSPVEGSRGGAPVAGEHLSGGFGAAWLVAAILVAGLGIMVFTDDDEDPVSP
jgi:hypothetical protein